MKLNQLQKVFNYQDTQVRTVVKAGKIKLKYQQPEFIRNEEDLLKYAEESAPEAIKVKKSVDWASLKKKAIIGPRLETEAEKYAVINKETGEIISGVEAVGRESKFVVEI